MQTEGLEQLLDALKKIALNKTGDLTAQVIAREAISEFEKKRVTRHDCQLANVHLDQNIAQLAWLVDWLTKVGLLQQLVCQPEANTPALPYWILRQPQMIDGSSVVGYGRTPEAAIAAAATPKSNSRISDDDCNAIAMALEFLEFNGEHVANCEVFDLDEHGAHKKCTCSLEATLKALRSAVQTCNTISA